MCISLLFGEHFNILNDRKSGELNVFREWKTGGNVLYNDINLLPFDCFSRKEWWRGCITLNTTKSNERNSSELIVLCFYSIWLLFLTYIFFYYLFRLLSVLRGHSGFFIPARTTNDLRLRRIFYPRFYPSHLFSYLNSWERASSFAFECSVLNNGTTCTIFIVINRFNFTFYHDMWPDKYLDQVFGHYIPMNLFILIREIEWLLVHICSLNTQFISTTLRASIPVSNPIVLVRDQLQSLNWWFESRLSPDFRV